MNIDHLALLLSNPAIGGDIQQLLRNPSSAIANPEFFFEQLSEQLRKISDADVVVPYAQPETINDLLQELELSAVSEISQTGNILPPAVIYDPVQQIEVSPFEDETLSFFQRGLNNPKQIVSVEINPAGVNVNVDAESESNELVRGMPINAAESASEDRPIYEESNRLRLDVAKLQSEVLDESRPDVRPVLADNTRLAVTNVAQASPQTTNHASISVERPVGQSGWNQELGARIVWMTGKEVDTAQIRVNPPQLGPVEVRINVNQDQASVAFTAQNAVVRDALEAAVPRLREMLGNQQLNLVNVDISQQSFANQQHQESRKETAYRDSQPNASMLSSNEEIEFENTENTTRSRSNGLLSYYV